MSPILKCLLGLLIVMCFVQFIEMAPVINDPLDIDWNKFFKESANRLKNNLNAEKFKKITESGTQQSNQLFESFPKPGAKISQ